VQHNNHSFLNGLLVLIEEKEKVDLVIGDRITDGRCVLIFSFELLSSVFNLSNNAYDINLAFRLLL
jgi:hypothetical protein